MASSTMSREEFVEWLRREFPRLLQEDARFSAEVIGILTQTLSSRSDTNRLLDEIRELREDFRRRFDAADRRFEAMEQRFQAADQRFESIIARLEKMDQRFEAADQRFEAIMARFEKVDQRFQAADQRFEAIMARFEKVDQRFEAVDRRFESIDAHLAEHSQLLGEHGRSIDRLTITVGSIGGRLGRMMEDAVRRTVEAFSGVGPLRAERLVLTDTDGEVFGVKGQAVEFDAYVHDGQRYLVEVKAHADAEDVFGFQRKLAFAAKHITEPFEAIMLAPHAHPSAAKACEQFGIRLLTIGMQTASGNDDD